MVYAVHSCRAPETVGAVIFFLASWLAARGRPWAKNPPSAIHGAIEALLGLDPDEHSGTLPARQWVLAYAGSKVEGIAVDVEIAHLGGPGPTLIPRGLDVMDDPAALDLVRAGVGDHAAVQSDGLGIAVHQFRRTGAALLDENGVHAAIGAVGEEAAGMRAEQVVLLVGLHV